VGRTQGATQGTQFARERTLLLNEEKMFFHSNGQGKERIFLLAKRDVKKSPKDGNFHKRRIWNSSWRGAINCETKKKGRKCVLDKKKGFLRWGPT